MNAKAKKLIARAAEVKAKLDEMKPLYEELDQLTQALSEELKPGAYKIPDFDVYLVDNFAEKNLCFRAHGMRRFELKVTRRVA